MRHHVLWSAALLGVAQLNAQQPVVNAASSSQTTYSLSGSVIDSLHFRPLVGADVMVAGTSLHATTDSSGVFRIDSLPAGTYKLGVFHPYLDSLSLAIATRETTVPLESGKRIHFGVPSAETVIRTVCPSAEADSNSVLMGTVVDVDTGAPVGGAKVIVSWTDYIFGFGKGARRPQRTPHKLEVTTNAAGGYRVCGLPADVGAGVVAQSGNAATDEIGVRSFSPSVMLLTLLVSKNPATRVNISGVVRDEKGAPLKTARIQMLGTTVAAVSDESGRFTLNGVAPGTRNIAVRRIGYLPASIPLQVTARSTAPLDIRLAKYVPILDTVFIKGRRDRGLSAVGFTSRKMHTLGEFVEREKFERHNPLVLTDILRNLRQVTIKYVNGYPVAVATRGQSCTKLYIDGLPWTLFEPRDLNTVVDVNQITAVEVYTGATVPAEFETAREHGCLTIVVWSRVRARDTLR